MLNVIKESFIFKIINRFVLWLQAVIQRSFIYNILTRDVDNRDKFKNSFFSKVLDTSLNAVRKIFRILKLDKLFRESIFSNTIIWIGITVAFVPFLSTIQGLILVFATICSFVLKIGMDENFKFEYAPVNIWIILFTIVYFFSACVSLDFNSSIKIAAIVISFILLYFVIINTIKTRKELDFLIKVFVLSAVVVSIYGIFQYYMGASFGSSSFVDQEMFEDITGRANATFDNPNTFGTYLLFVIPLSVSLIFSEKKWFQKIIMIGAFFVMIIVLALTYSRGCYLGVILSIGIFMLLANLKFIVLFLGALVVSPFILPQSIINRFASIGNLSESSASYRVSIWRGAIEMIKNFWHTPIGQGSTAFNSVYPLYALNAVYAEHSHNLFLQIIIETSFIGFVLFMGMLVSFYRYLLSGIKLVKDKACKLYLIAFVSGMSGFLLQSIFDNTWYNNRIILIFWIFVAIAIRVRSEVKNEKN